MLEQARAQLQETLRCDPQPSSARLAERVRLAQGGSELIDVVWVMERGLHHHQRSHRGLLALQRARELLGLGNTLVDCAKPNDGRIVGLADAAHRCPAGSRLVKLAAEYCVES